MASPIRIHHGLENNDSIARKPEVKNPTRKPFVDRSVNATPLPKNNILPIKQPHFIQDKIKTPKQKLAKYPDWLLDVCNYKDVFDDCWDILPSSNRNLQEGLTSYFYPQTPPFRSKIDTFMELPEVESIFPPKKFKYPKLEEIDEPPIPNIDVEF